MSRWVWLAVAALVILLAWQSWSIVALREEVTRLRDEIARSAGAQEKTRGGGDDAATLGGHHTRATSRSGTAVAVAERRGRPRSAPTPSPTEPRWATPFDPETLDQAVERTLDRVEQARFQKKSEHWLQAASDRIDRVVGELVDAGEVPEAVREEVSDLLRNQIYFTWQVKDDVRTGALDEAAATARWRTNRAGVVSSLTELVGEETASDLLDRASGGK